MKPIHRRGPAFLTALGAALPIGARAAPTPADYAADEAFTDTLRLPVDGRDIDVEFDDWMYLMDERAMLNKAVMSKFGVRLGEVTLSFYKHG